MLGYISVCEKILKLLKNTTTKVKVKENLKGSYYAYITDTIYLPKENINEDVEERLIVICHECIHSVQSKKMHKINFILSNFEILLSIILLISICLKTSFLWILVLVYLTTLVFSIIIRVILEKDAVKRSFPLTMNVINKKVVKCEINRVDMFEKKAKKAMILFYMFLFWKKLIKLVLISVIYYII